MISENINDVKNKIEKICIKANRRPDEVTLIAVSKTKPIKMLEAAYQSGIRDFGENKVQELQEKIPQMPKDVKWHMIGHLQTNKVKYIVDKVYMIHSVDSLRLAEEISKEAVKKNVIVKILIEVNVAEEESKFGVSVAETRDLVRRVAILPGVKIEGLMTIAPYVENDSENRVYFN